MNEQEEVGRAVAEGMGETITAAMNKSNLTGIHFVLTIVTKDKVEDKAETCSLFTATVSSISDAGILGQVMLGVSEKLKRGKASAKD